MFIQFATHTRFKRYIYLAKSSWCKVVWSKVLISNATLIRVKVYCQWNGQCHEVFQPLFFFTWTHLGSWKKIYHSFDFVNFPAQPRVSYRKKNKDPPMRIVSLRICTVSFSYNLFIFYLQPTSAYFLLLILYSIHRAICRPSDHSVGKPPALGRDSNPGRADLLVGTLTIRPPHLPVFLVIRFLPELSQRRKNPLFASYWKNLGRVPYTVYPHRHVNVIFELAELFPP